MSTSTLEPGGSVADWRDPVMVLVVEDNAGDAELVRQALLETEAGLAAALGGFRCARASSLAEGLAHLSAHPVDVVLLDLHLPDSVGLATLDRARSQAPDVPIVMLTGLADDETALTAVRAGAQDYLVKGQVDGVVLVRAIRYAIERMRAERDRRRLIEEEAARRRAERAEARAAKLVAASHGFASARLEELAVLEAVASHTAGAVGDGAFVALLSEDGDWLAPIAAHHPRTTVHELARTLLRGQAIRADGRALVGLLRHGRPLLLPVLTSEMARQMIDPEHHPFLERAGVHALIGAPLWVEERVIGALFCWRDAPARPYDEDDARLLHDLADRAALALGMARSYAAARAAVSARDEFLGVAAHELRSPVTAIKGNAQLMARHRDRGTLDDARLDRLIANILDGTERLTELTADLLDVSRIRAGQLAVRRRPIDLVALVDRVVAHWRDRVDGRHQIEARLPSDPLVVAADAGRLEEVIDNLLANAVKYSPDGGPVTVSLGSDGEGATLSVRDEGIGLPDGAVDVIFTPFQRAANATARGLPGMGLGLFIGRNIVERHGGRLWAESDGEGRGTTMRVRLPRGDVDAAETGSEDGAHSGQSMGV